MTFDPGYITDRVGELSRTSEPERLLLPGDVEFDDPFFTPFPELDDYDVELDLLP